MKNIRFKNILRGIRDSLPRFLSILFIVALGSGFMAGLAATSPDMYDTADLFMDDCHWYDWNIQSTLGFTATDVSAIRSLDFVDAVLPARVADLILLGPEEKTYTARVYAFLQNNMQGAMNQFQLTEGRLPSKQGECVIQVISGKYFGGKIELGDTLTLSSENPSYDTLKEQIQSESLTIVGFVQSPMGICVSSESSTIGTGKIAMDVYVAEDFFSFPYDTNLYVTMRNARELDTFSDTYTSRISDYTESLLQTAEVLEQRRTEEVKNDANAQLQNLQAFLSAAQSTVDVRAHMAESSVASLQNTAVTAQTLGQNAPVLAQLLSQTGNAVQESLRHIDQENNEALLQTLSATILKAQDAAASIENCIWRIQNRENTVGFSNYKSNVGKVAALSKIFPAFFFMVALLVALTTMTRLVEENRGQIGTLKALGFSNGQIIREYLLYSLSSSLLGCILGFSIGFRLFPMAISSAYRMMFTIPTIQTPIRWNIVLWVAPVTIGSILSATLWACWHSFRACPAVLMQPKAPAAGKRIWLEFIPCIWKHLPFIHKVTCRNLFRYKKRFFMTIIGVAGCSALLLTGFGLRDSINDIVDKQFGELYQYTLQILLKEPDALSDNSLQTILQDTDKIARWLPISSVSGTVSFQNKSENVTITIPKQTADFQNFILLRNRKSHAVYDYPENGVILTEKLCETLGISIGDAVVLENGTGKTGETVVVGITENYISSSAYISPETYPALFGEAPQYTSLLACVPATSSSLDDTVITTLMATDAVLYASSSSDLKENFSNSIRSIDGVILVLILSAGLLSMVVLYNLTNVNICERRKELATIRVLGFHQEEVSSYIFRETDILSILGALFGLLLGIWLHSYVVRTVEIDQIMFGRTIYFHSYLYSLLLSAFFTCIVNLVLRRKIRHVDMVEAMKAND